MTSEAQISHRPSGGGFPRKSLWRIQPAIFAWIIALCAGVGAAVGLQPFLCEWLDAPERIDTLHRAVAGGAVSPNGSAVFLGNSVSMNGIDTRLIHEELGMSPPFLNLSSGGQRLWESLLVLDSLPSSCGTICIGVSADQIFQESIAGPAENVLSKYWMSGFNPSPEYLAWAQRLGATNIVDFFELNRLGKLVACRWVLTNFINTGLRTAVRRDLDLDRSEEDLFYPAPYTKPLAKEKLKTLLPAVYGPLFGKGIDEKQVDHACEVLAFGVETARRKGQNVFFVLMPVHPYAQELLGTEYGRFLRRKLSDLVGEDRILDLSDHLPEERFIDQCHPDPDGAKLVSRKVAAFLRPFIESSEKH